MRRLAEGVHVFEVPQTFYGLQLGARMTVLDTGDGLLAISPVDAEPEAYPYLRDVRWALSPNLFHHLYAGSWIERGVETWACRGLPEKRPDLAFAGTISPGAAPFGAQIWLLPLACLEATNEVVVLHRPSGTLVVTDLLFHLPPSAPWLTRQAFRLVGAYPGCRTSVLERFGINREVARAELRQILAEDWDRLVMAHGEVIETGGKAALRGAFDWLGLDD